MDGACVWPRCAKTTDPELEPDRTPPLPYTPYSYHLQSQWICEQKTQNVTAEAQSQGPARCVRGVVITAMHRQQTEEATGLSLKGRGVLIRGLQLKPELNGARGVYLEEVADTGRIAVRVTTLQDGRALSPHVHLKLKPECIILEEPSVVAAARPSTATNRPVLSIEAFREGSLSQLSGGTFIDPQRKRWHQSPKDGDLLISDDELAQEFVDANEDDFTLAQVDRNVLAALWQICNVDSVQESSLFLETGKLSLRAAAAKANTTGHMRMFLTQSICQPLVHPLPSEPESLVAPTHPFRARAVQTQYLAFQVFPLRPDQESLGLQTVQFLLGLHDRSHDAVAKACS